MNLIDGRALAEKIKDGIAKEIYALNGPRPGLAIILIGERSDSQLYVRLKEKQSRAVGIDTHVYYCEADITQDKIIETINFLNKDDSVDAILVQLPLPSHLDTETIVNTISPEKDVDGFTKKNLEALMKNDMKSAVLPPVYAVILTILSSINQPLTDKKITLVANSDIFVGNLAEVLKRQGGNVIIADSKDKNLSSLTKEADIIITAIGKPHYITKEMVQPGATIIDIGISTDSDGKVQGDVDADSLKDIQGYLTPVPGGVGPMTIAMAFWNTLEIFKRRKQLHSDDN